jgi:hypothetical protein
MSVRPDLIDRYQVAAPAAGSLLLPRKLDDVIKQVIAQAI